VEGVVTDTGTSPRRILITGVMGYVGPAVVRTLRGAFPSTSLIGFDAGYFAHCLTNVAAVPERGLDCLYFGDIRRPPEGLLADVDAVVHLAAISNDPIGNRYEEVTLEINHQATVRLAQLAKNEGARAFVFASSCSIYGLSEEGAVSEGSPPNPLTPYARSKWLAERDLRGLADESFMVTSLRFGTACGMSDRLRLDVVLNDFVASAVSTGEITILSDGTPWRPLIHVRDMARAVEWAIHREVSDGGPFLALNVGSDRWNYRIKELAEAVAEVIPGVRVSIDPAAGPDPRSYRVDFDLFEQLAPRHQPQVDLREAVSDLRDGLESMGFSDTNFRSSRFVRLQVLSELRERGMVTEKLEWVSNGNGYRPAH
jgi:nucleoside-diphosphate-sugar epimerase